MKKGFIGLALLFAFSFSRAQIGGIIKDHVKNHVNTDVGNETDKALDKIDPTKQEDQNGNSNDQQGNSSSENSTSSSSSGSETTSSSNTPPSVTAYQNYDFRAGDKIIFADNFATDADGEFPAHWDLVSGQAVINKVGGIPSFLLTDGNYCKVKPLMKTDSYLTNNFSIEFDTYLTDGAYGIMVFFHNSQDQSADLQFSSEGVKWSPNEGNSNFGSHPSAIQYANYTNRWNHIAIAYKNDQLKVYVNQYRVLVVPHCNMQPGSLEFGGIGSVDNPMIIKDIKIADGASMNMLDAIMTDGKFITHGINFDVNSANIKPESMGVIGDVAKYMKEHSDLKLEIDGHTDSDGGDDANMKLSQARAESVKSALVAAGIDVSRLSTKGLGESKPMAKNDSPEGKAENRRVEFVKI